MQIYTKAFLPLTVLLSITAFSQEKVQDTTKTSQLEEVVVTGQYEPQSIKKSVHNVRVITKKDIQQQAANNLADVLNQYLNITVQPNGNDGRSTVSMFGLDGQYFKVLVDNVPLVSDTGLGNNIDLTQINLDDIEQIEIIEGSMGVTHGANAVTGVLNIITKKSSVNKWEVSATAQEETVGKEFDFFDKGRHIQKFRISHSISENWFAAIGANRNDFAGYFGDKEGKDYAVNDGNRGYTWLPKEQYVTNAMLSYSKNGFRMFYKFDYLNENIDFYHGTVNSIANPPFETIRTANDKRYITERFYHHLNASGKAGELNYNVSLSHQRQSRDVENFVYNLNTSQEENNKKVTDQSTEVLYSTGTVSNFFPNSILDLQLGYEIVNTNGYSLVVTENNFEKEVRKHIENYDFFVSSEIKATEKFSIRPGIRVSAQSKFKDQYATSLGLRYLFNDGIELRGSIGQSYRTPNFEELYSELIFSGHYFIGNENLIPEISKSYEISLKKNSFLKSGVKLVNNLMVSYIDVDDKIDMALIGLDPTPMYQYINISKYKIWNIATNHQVDYKNWSFRTGVSLVGVSQKKENGVAVSDDKFVYFLQLNSMISYEVPKWNTLFSLYYKYNGKQQRFYETTDENGPTYKLSDIDSYSWMDASVRKSFFKNQLDVTLGARNILDITNIQQSQTSAGAAHPTSSDILLGYGRSYFAKLTYNLNF